MALTDENGNGMVMPVTPMGSYGGGNCSGFGDGDGWWIILLFILLAGNNGWGNGFGGNNNDLYPWMNQAEITNSGFRDQMINSNVDGIQQGINSLSNQICSGFADIEQGANARQMADMNQAFAAQTAMAQGFNNLSSQFANCCCENRLGTADLKYTVATENCADRQALSDGVRDIITNQTASTQAILDKMCQQEIDAKNEKIADLERQLTMANLSASQNLQTQQLLTDNLAQTNALEQYLAPVPRPAYVVQNPNCCPSTGCGCGCSNL